MAVAQHLNVSIVLFFFSYCRTRNIRCLRVTLPVNNVSHLLRCSLQCHLTVTRRRFHHGQPAAAQELQLLHHLPGGDPTGTAQPGAGQKQRAEAQGQTLLCVHYNRMLQFNWIRCSFWCVHICRHKQRIHFLLYYSASCYKSDY